MSVRSYTARHLEGQTAKKEHSYSLSATRFETIAASTHPPSKKAELGYWNQPVEKIKVNLSDSDMMLQ